MKKRAIARNFIGLSLSLMLMACSGSGLSAQTSQPADVNVSVHGQAVGFDGQPPVVVDGRTLVPVRAVFEQLGFTVTWDDVARAATITRGADVLVITIGSDRFTTNGIPHTLDVYAQIIGSSTMVPIRLPLESVGYTVGWQEGTRTVTVGHPAPAVAQTGGALANYSTLAVPREQTGYFTWIDSWSPRPSHPIPSFVMEVGDVVATQTTPAGENMQFFFATIPVASFARTTRNWDDFFNDIEALTANPSRNWTMRFDDSFGERIIFRQMLNPQTGERTGWIPIGHFNLPAPRPPLNHQFVEDFNRIDADESIILVRMDVAGRTIFLEEEVIFNLGRYMTPISRLEEYLTAQVNRPAIQPPYFATAWVFTTRSQTFEPYNREFLATWDAELFDHWSNRAITIEEAREIMFLFYVDNLPHRRLTDDERNQWIAHYRATGGINEFEREVARLVNEIRVGYGLSPVEISDTLSMAARFYTQQRHDLNLGLGHNEGPYGDGRGTMWFGGTVHHGASAAVVRAFGGQLRWNGGNGGGGTPSPENMVNSWMNSPGHRAYILSPEHRFVGVGHTPGGNYHSYLLLSNVN